MLDWHYTVDEQPSQTGTQPQRIAQASPARTGRRRSSSAADPSAICRGAGQDSGRKLPGWPAVVAGKRGGALVAEALLIDDYTKGCKR
jgi:hypothetical protein